MDVVAQVLGEVGNHGGYGLTLPAVVTGGVARSAANIDPSWIGIDAAALAEQRTGRRPVVVNDADAAGVAEARFGAAKDEPGTVLVLTLGTGIGSALLLDGALLPNTELGHLELDGHDAEKRAAADVRTRHELTWEQWAQRLEHYLRHVHMLLWPDLVVIGGGVSKRAEKWLPLLDVPMRVVPAELQNDAGIIGAALLAADPAQPSTASDAVS